MDPFLAALVGGPVLQPDPVPSSHPLVAPPFARSQVPRTAPQLRNARVDALPSLHRRLTIFRPGYVTFVNPQPGPPDPGPRSPPESALLPPALRAIDRDAPAAPPPAPADSTSPSPSASTACSDCEHYIRGCAHMSFLAAPLPGDLPSLTEPLAHAPDRSRARAWLRAHIFRLQAIVDAYTSTPLAPYLDSLFHALDHINVAPQPLAVHGADTPAVNCFGTSMDKTSLAVSFKAAQTTIACTPGEYQALTIFAAAAGFPLHVLSQTTEFMARALAEHGWEASAAATVERSLLGTDAGRALVNTLVNRDVAYGTALELIWE